MSVGILGWSEGAQPYREWYDGLTDRGKGAELYAMLVTNEERRYNFRGGSR